MKTVLIVLATLAALWVIRDVLLWLATVMQRRIAADVRNCAYCFKLGAARWIYTGKGSCQRLGICASCLPTALGPVPLDWALARGFVSMQTATKEEDRCSRT